MRFQRSVNKLSGKLKNIPDTIQWKIGTIISPQHFQQLSKRYDHLFQYALGLPSTYQWGLIHYDLELQSEGTKLVVNELEAIMPNGEPVIYDKQLNTDHNKNNQHVLSLDLKFKKDNIILPIYLGIYKIGTRPINSECFNLYKKNFEDDYNENEKENISFLKPRLLLAQENISESDCCSFQIARIIKNKEHISFDESYIPPFVWIDKNSEIMKLCNNVIETLRKKIEEYEFTESTSFENKMTLHHLFTALPVLEVMSNTERIIPFNIYLALSSIAGSVGILPSESKNRFPKVESYDHNDLFSCFKDITSFIITTTENCFTKNYDSFPFEYDESNNYYSLDIEKEMFEDNYLIIGVDRKVIGQDNTEQDIDKEVFKEWMEECKIKDIDYFNNADLKNEKGAEHRAEIHRSDLPSDLEVPRSMSIYHVAFDDWDEKEGKLIISPPQSRQEIIPTVIKLFKKRK